MPIQALGRLLCRDVPEEYLGNAHDALNATETSSPKLGGQLTTYIIEKGVPNG